MSYDGTGAPEAATITAIRFPVPWVGLGFGSSPAMGGVALATGAPAWMWQPEVPALPIEEASPGESVEVPGWDVDHVVVTTPDLEDTVAALAAAGADDRRRAQVRGRPAAFLLAGLLVEVVEVSGAAHATLWGLALATEHPLDEVVARWRERGFAVSDPRRAVQPGRRIFRLGGTTLAVMSVRPG